MSCFTTNVLKLATGNVLAQALTILLFPIITRLYSPGDYGILVLLIAISSTLVTVSCLSYEFSIMLPKEEKDSAIIVVLCFILICLVSIISGSVFILLSSPIEKLLNAPGISHYMIFLPAVVLLSGLFIVMNYWLSRRIQFGVIATAAVALPILTKAIQIFFALGSTSPRGLIIGAIAGYAGALVVMLYGIKDDLPFFKGISLVDIKRLAVRYKRFPLFNSWSALANMASLQIAPLMLATFFSPVVAGLFGMANAIANTPMSLIGASIGQVFFQKASEEKNQRGCIKEVVREVHRRLVSFGLFPILVLMIIGEDLFGLVFGTQWSAAGEYARILAPWIFLVFIASPLTTIFSVLEKQQIGLYFNLLILISRFTVLYIGGRYGNIFATLVLYSITGMLFWGIMNLYILKISGVPYREAIEDFMRPFFIAAIIAIPIILIKFLMLSIYLLFLVSGIMTVTYYAIIIFQDPLLKEQCKKFLRG